LTPLSELPPIPEKLSFKIGQASKLVGVEPHVLRFWEKEFSRVRPQKGRNGHRLYSQADLRLLRRVRGLLHEHRYTIAGAKALLREGNEAVNAVLDGRPLAAAAALDEASSEADGLRARAVELEGERDQSKRELAHAKEEAAFWRRAARRAEENVRRLEGNLRTITDAIRDHASELKRASSLPSERAPESVDTGVSRP